jgi:hypothetical protein
MHQSTLTIFAALASLCTAAPRFNIKRSGLGDVYHYYSGNGTTAAGWPTKSDWVTFDDMWLVCLPPLSPLLDR